MTKLKVIDADAALVTALTAFPEPVTTLLPTACALTIAEPLEKVGTGTVAFFELIEKTRW
jgi:hypothetical protein